MTKIIKLLFNSEHIGKYYKLISPYIDTDSYKLPDSLYEVFSVDIYKKICDSLDSNKLVLIPDAIDAATLQTADIIIQDQENALSAEKERVKNFFKDRIVLRDLIGDVLAPILDFITSASTLFSYQYFITDKNENEIYANIISDNNTEALDAYRKFIVSKKMLNKVVSKYSDISTLIKMVDKISSHEELASLYDSYKEKVLNTLIKEDS